MEKIQGKLRTLAMRLVDYRLRRQVGLQALRRLPWVRNPNFEVPEVEQEGDSTVPTTPTPLEQVAPSISWGSTSSVPSRLDNETEPLATSLEPAELELRLTTTTTVGQVPCMVAVVGAARAGAIRVTHRLVVAEAMVTF
jgi:hypothetical protein